MSSGDGDTTDLSKSSSSTGKVIAPIAQQDIDRIVSGQAILDLASSVKELIDNSLDAGATSINIRLFNQGLDVIEVSDDGIGVPLHSRPLMAMKHATSKIRSFDDLNRERVTSGGQTLGFRGEALFCLANISQALVVSTKTALDDLGQKMQFRRDGSLDPLSVIDIPRKVGTTIAVVKLFDAFPVRRADLIKRIKTHRTKLMRLLQSYAILCVGVRFNVIDVTGIVGSQQCKSDTRMSTSEKSKSFDETVSAVLGARFLAGMCTVKIDLSSLIGKEKDATSLFDAELNESERANHSASITAEGTVGNASIQPSTTKTPWLIEGLVSRAPGATESSKIARDVQIFSLNGRPVEMPKFSRIIVDTWRLFDTGSTTNEEGSRKRPACVLAITVPNSMIDVNLSPDKRDVILLDEDSIGFALRDELERLWAIQTEGQFKVDEAASQSSKKRSASEFESLPTSKMFRTSEGSEKVTTNVMMLCSHEQTPGSGIHEPSMTSSGHLITNTRSERLLLQQAKLRFNVSDSHLRPDDMKTVSDRNTGNFQNLVEPHTPVIPNTSNVTRDIICTVTPTPIFSRQHCSGSIDPKVQSDKVTRSSSSDSHDSTSLKVADELKAASERTSPEPVRCSVSSSKIISLQSSSKTNAEKEERDDVKKIPGNTFSFGGTDAVIKQYLSVRNQMKRSKKLLAALRNQAPNASCNESILSGTDFIEEEEQTPKQVTVSFSKGDFKTMEVVGQFNLGFILARCKNRHLWILDQHACDERKNFETLYAETVLHEQQLLKPLPLELSPSEETCILENKDIFAKNGFRFIYDETKPSMHRLALTALPHSGSGGDGHKAVQFGKDDVGALCALLGADGASSSSGYIAGSGSGADGAGTVGNNAVRRYASMGHRVIRLPKTVAMIASRACRSSRMIGEALSLTEMQSIIRNLQVVEQPWTCPHGRPTMRHVKDLLPFLLGDEETEEKIISGPTLTFPFGMIRLENLLGFKRLVQIIVRVASGTVTE